MDTNERISFYIINNHEKRDKNIEIEKQIIKRNYGIDLLRIFAMINIINLHINLLSGQLSLNFSSPKFYNIWYLEIFSFWPVDVFGLISGIVGYKRYKFSNLIYLWIRVCFYSSTISLYIYFIKNYRNKKKLILSLFPILIKRHWYVNAYFSMYILLPIINYGINSLNRKLYRNLIIFFILFYSIYNIVAIIFGDKNYHFLINGYSSMWLIILYIIGGYFGKYIIINKQKKKLIHFVIYIIIYFFSSFIPSKICFNQLKKKNKIIKNILINYLSPSVILQAVSLIMLFSSLNINNKLIIKIISFLAPLSFSALLLHSHLFKSNIKIIINLFRFINGFKNNLLLFKIYATSILIYLLCVFIDYFRLCIFKLFKIREFCLFLEYKIPLLFDK